MINFVDTHTHLYDDVFIADRKEIILRAQNKGVTKMVLPGIDSTYHDSLVDLAKEFPEIAFPAAGLHPTSVNTHWEKEYDFLNKKLSEGHYIAVGEIGMDGYWSKEFINEQKDAFFAQIELSSKYNIPIIIHSRDATEEIFDVLENSKNLNISGVFHAFSGSWETYKRILKYGNFFVGIGGVVTYKNSHLPDVVQKIDLSNILLETDSPWLTPVPYRGKRNEPSYIELIADSIARIKNCTIEEVAETTTLNAQKLFKI